MKTIRLNYPVSINGIVTHELTMRRPKVRDRLAAERASGSEADRELGLFAQLLECAPDDLKELDLADYRQLQETFTGFLSFEPMSSVTS